MKNILIIDDDFFVRQLLRDLLEANFYDVTEASNGADGITLQAQKPFDLIITDIVMPEKEGLETIIELKRKYPTTRIVAISGQGKMIKGEYLDIAKKLGAHAVFSKPVDPDLFIEEIKRLLS